MVGSAIALTLSKSHTVRLLDRDAKVLTAIANKKITKTKVDLRNEVLVRKYIKDSDLVVGAVPGFMGFELMKQVIEAGKNMVDISFFPENALRLDKLAKKKKVTAVFDCGVAPGMDNILLGYHDQSMQVENFSCYVGGLPKIRSHPFDYKAPFSPADVLEEYTRPARIKEHGHERTKPALTDLEHIHTPQGHNLEAFNSDGLRSLLLTMKHIPSMKEKTLRYPGHARQMEFLRELGLLSKKPVNTKQGPMTPLDFTSSLLFKHWKYHPGEEDFIFMRTIIEGKENGEPIRYTYDLYDEYDKSTRMSAMARTTGLTACAVAEWLLNQPMNQPGVIAPEILGQSKPCFDFILSYLKNHQVSYHKKMTRLD